MTIFPDTPKLTKAYRRCLAPHIANEKKCRRWLATCPSNADIKRAVLLEIESGRSIPDRQIVNMLIIRLQRNERHTIWSRIAMAKGVWP